MKKKKMKDLDKYVLFSLSAIIIFTIVAVVVQIFTEQELSSTLITCFFSCFGGELLMLAMIKKLKLKEGKKNDEFSGE
jgi:archaellum biogenesis protein FlaJ (TadC family)